MHFVNGIARIELFSALIRGTNNSTHKETDISAVLEFSVTTPTAEQHTVVFVATENDGSQFIDVLRTHIAYIW